MITLDTATGQAAVYEFTDYARENREASYEILTRSLVGGQDGGPVRTRDVTSIAGAASDLLDWLGTFGAEGIRIVYERDEDGGARRVPVLIQLRSASSERRYRMVR